MSRNASIADQSAGAAWRTFSGARLLKLPRADGPRFDGLLALLVTDLEGFTSLVEHHGDAKAQRIIQEHNRMLRSCVERRSGREVAHTGDGIIAAFRSVAAAIECAREIQLAAAEAAREPGGAAPRLRVGLHAGEPLPEEGRLFGHCVNLAVRICAQAEAGAILASDVIRQLAQGRFEFEPGQALFLKGISAPVHLYAFDWTRRRESVRGIP